jgi:phospholipase/lecithinase/hemolysin
MHDVCEGPKICRTLRIAAVTALLLVLSAGAASSGAAEFRGVVAFGDSLSDMGNRWVKPGMTGDKFRKTWVAQLAGPGLLNVDGFKPSGTSFFFGGFNYAVGGAGTEFTANLSSARNGSENLTTQISKRYLNPAFNTAGVQKDALHVIVIGTNDLMFASASLDQITTKWAGMEAVGRSVAKSTESQIQALAAAGVTHVLWGSVFDIAQAPAVARRAKLAGEYGSGIYLGALTKAAVAHNAEMDAAIARLTKANASLKLIKLDLAAKFAAVSADPSKFGFVDVKTGANDAQHLFSADGLHPTPQGHKMLAEYACTVVEGRPPVAQANAGAAQSVQTK